MAGEVFIFIVLPVLLAFGVCLGTLITISRWSSTRKVFATWLVMVLGSAAFGALMFFGATSSYNGAADHSGIGALGGVVFFLLALALLAGSLLSGPAYLFYRKYNPA